MERPNTVSGLIDKRREIVGQIEAAQRQVRKLIVDLDHIDAAIRLFDPDADLATIRPRQFPPRHQAFRGEMVTACYTAMREAAAPVTSVEIAKRVMQARGMDTADKGALVLIRKRVGACLYKLRERGEIASVPLEGEYMGWTLATGTADAR